MPPFPLLAHGLICLVESKARRVPVRYTPKPSLVRPTDNEIHPPDYPPIASEDLVKLGVESQFIPFIVSATQWAEQSPDGPPPLNTTEAEGIIEILDKVRPTRKPPSRSKKTWRSARVIQHREPEHEAQVFQSSTQAFTFAGDPSQIILSGRSDPERHRPSCFRQSCGCLERSAGRGSGVCEGISNSDDGAPGQN